MGKKNKKTGVVYSTNPDFEYNYESDEVEETLPSAQQLLYVSLDRKQRAGKEVTLIEGFVGTPDDLKKLGKDLKSHCGTGGTVKDGQILIQGDQRDKVTAYLEKNAYKFKRKGG